MVVDGTEGFAGCVHHGSRCVVHRTYKHAQVGSSHIIAWEVVERATVHYRLPFGILQSLYTFKVQDVGIGALYTVWLESMQVQYQAVLAAQATIRSTDCTSGWSSRSKKSILKPLIPICA